MSPPQHPLSRRPTVLTLMLPNPPLPLSRRTSSTTIGGASMRTPHTPLNPQTPPFFARRISSEHAPRSSLDSANSSFFNDDDDDYVWTEDQLGTITKVGFFSPFFFRHEFPLGLIVHSVCRFSRTAILRLAGLPQRLHTSCHSSQTISWTPGRANSNAQRTGRTLCAPSVSNSAKWPRSSLPRPRTSTDSTRKTSGMCRWNSRSSRRRCPSAHLLDRRRPARTRTFLSEF